MPEQRENYKGKEIVIDTEDDQIQVRIDGSESKLPETKPPGDT